jgi:hypothetical protein
MVDTGEAERLEEGQVDGRGKIQRAVAKAQCNNPLFKPCIFTSLENLEPTKTFSSCYLVCA